MHQFSKKEHPDQEPKRGTSKQICKRTHFSTQWRRKKQHWTVWANLSYETRFSWHSKPKIWRNIDAYDQIQKKVHEREGNLREEMKGSGCRRRRGSNWKQLEWIYSGRYVLFGLKGLHDVVAIIPFPRFTYANCYTHYACFFLFFHFTCSVICDYQ